MSAALAYVNRTDQVLGNAGSSPLLTAMALNVFASGQEPRTRAALYSAFLDGLAARAGSEDTEILFGWLGAAFARLLEQGQRQADRLTWSRTMSETVQILADNGIQPIPAPMDALNEAIRIGILVRPLPFMAIGAFHDSFGDYLAAAAALHRLAASPNPALPSQEEQMVFLCEMGGLTSDIAEKAAASAPLIAAKIASLDFRATTERDEQETGNLLQALIKGTVLAESMAYPIQLRAQGRYIHVSWSTGATKKAILVPARHGPLSVAVAMWGSLLRDAMRPEATSERLPQVRTASEGAERLIDHQRATQRAVARMVDDLMPTAARRTIHAALPPLGIEAVVYEDNSPISASERLYVAYTRTADSISARAGNSPESGTLDMGRTLLSSILSKDPATTAADTLAAVLARETDGKWPR